MHSAQILAIASSPDDKLLATASYDKTVKIWEADTGKIIRTIRPPIGLDVEGTLNTVAFSVDGKSIATGGDTGNSWNKSYSVYIFDVQSGEMTHHITNLPQFINRLSYSPDGSRLAVAFAEDRGVSVLRTSDYKQLWSDNSFKGNCFGMDFDKKGNLAVASDQGIIRMYKSDGTLLYEQTTEKSKRIYTLRFSPDGKFMALGYEDLILTVEIRNASDGSPAFVLTSPGSRGYLASVVWSNDGKSIFASGLITTSDSRIVLFKWSVKGNELEDKFVLPVKSYVRHLIALQNGSIAFVSGLNGFGVLSRDGGGRQIRLSWGRSQMDYTEVNTNGGGLDFFNPIAAADFRKNHYSFKIAPDSSAVFFSYVENGQAKATFNLKNRKLITDNIPETAELIPPRFTANGIDIQSWDSWKSFPPRLNGKELAGGFSQRDRNFSLAVKHDDSGFILGSIMHIRSYNSDGKILWQKRIPGVAWDVNISADDRILVAALDDSTIRWYRLDNGQELFTLYLHPDKKRWVLWSPEGFFDHGPNSEDLVGFHVNQGSDKEGMLVSINQMYDTFYRPDIIDLAINGKDVSGYLKNLAKPAGVTVASAKTEETEKERLAREKTEQENLARQKTEKERQIALKGDKKLQGEPAEQSPEGSSSPSATALLIGSLINASTLPPTVRFITSSGAASRPDVTLVAELCDNGGGIGDVTLFLNEMPVAIDNISRGLKVQQKTSSTCYKFERTISLQNGRNLVSLMAYNRGNSIESERRKIELEYASTAAEKPDLHILTIAVNKYRDGDLQLKYAINDADVLARVTAEKARGMFAGVHVHKLHNEDVTKEKLEAAFVKIGKQTKRDDVFVLFVAGHGITGERDGAYYFLPSNFRYTGEESIAAQGVSMNDFKKYLINIQATKSLLLIDTCNSGSFSEAIASRGVAEKTAINKLARAMGRATISASSRNQVALEGYEGHGVFSYTVLEGLKGKASNKKGEITVNLLANFIEETLPEITYKKWGYEQVPQKSLQGMDFPIGMR